MGPLSVHQSKSSDHGRLGFHPDCPTCRQDRLFGALSPDPVVRRLPVLLAAGVLALSAGATATSVAAEPDSQHEGLAAPEPIARSTPTEPTAPTPVAPPRNELAEPGDGRHASDELGQHSGGETALPFDVAPVPSQPQGDPPGGADETEPLEAEPTEDRDGRLSLTDPDPPLPLEVHDETAPPTEPAPLSPPPPPVPPPTGPELPADPIPKDAPHVEPEGDRQDGSRRRTKAQRRTRDQGKRGRHDRARHVASEPAPAPATPAPTSSTAAADAASDSTPEPATTPAAAGEFHVVRPGESLWSIATDLLGHGASTEAIARKVRRLWELNRERIGTGDPNLLPVGVTLRLR